MAQTTKAKQSIFSKKNILKNIDAILIGLGAFIFSVFYLTNTLLTAHASKITFLFAGLIILVFLWVKDSLKFKEFFIPKSSLIYTFGLIILVSFISAMFAPDIMQAVSGIMFEPRSVLYFVLLGATLFLVSTFFYKHSRVKGLYTGLFYGTLFLVIIFFFNMFGFRGLELTLENINFVASLFGLIAVMSAWVLQFGQSKFREKLSLRVALGVSILLLAFINFPAIWVAILIASILSLIYVYSVASSFKKKPLYLLILVFFSSIFLLGGNIWGNVVSKFAIPPQNQQLDSIVDSSVINSDWDAENYLVGSGTNSFIYAWNSVRADSYPNLSTDIFVRGKSFISTLVVENGFIGLAAWTLFLLSLVISGIKTMSQKYKQKKDRLYIIGSLILSFYLWTLAVINYSSMGVVILAIVTTGIFISLQLKEQVLPIKKINLNSGTPKDKLIYVITILLVVVLSLYAIFVFGKRFRAFNNYTSGLSLITITAQAAENNPSLKQERDNQIKKAIEKIEKSIALYNSDILHRASALLTLEELRSELKKTSPDKEKVAMKTEEIISLAKEAVNIDPTDTVNWLLLLNVYQNLAILNVDDAYEKSVELFAQIQERFPYEINLYTSRARFHIEKGNNTEIQKFINNVQEKNLVFPELFLVFDQFERNRNDINAAVRALSSGVALFPNNEELVLTLAQRSFGNKDYKTTINALENYLRNRNGSIDALYLLSQAYERSGNSQQALGLLRLLEARFADNTQIKNDIGRIEAKMNNPIPVTPDILQNISVTVEEAERVSEEGIENKEMKD